MNFNGNYTQFCLMAEEVAKVQVIFVSGDKPVYVYLFLFYLPCSIMPSQVGISIILQIWKDQSCHTSVLIYQE